MTSSARGGLVDYDAWMQIYVPAMGELTAVLQMVDEETCLGQN
jgi:hypothetical protein